MRIVVSGSGHLPYYLAKAILAKGHEMILVNKAEEEAELWARTFRCMVFKGDATDLSILEQVLTQPADVVMALNIFDEDNFFLCRAAHQLFNVKRTISLVVDPDRESTFKKMGISATLSVARVFGTLLEEKLTMEDVFALPSIAGGDVFLSIVPVTADSPFMGRSIPRDGTRKDRVIAGVIRGESVLPPTEEAKLEVGDRVVGLVTPKEHRQFLRIFTGE